MHLRFSPKIRLLGAAPNPPARAATLPCQTLHMWSGYAPLRALNTEQARRYRWACYFSCYGLSGGAPSSRSTLALAVKTACISFLAAAYSA